MNRYEPADASVREVIERVINNFPDKFIHININDLHLTFKDAETSTWKARTRLLNDFYQSLTKKKLAIEVWKGEWISSDLTHRAAIIYHELMHITYDTKKNEYKLRRHDVQDFYDVLKTFGLNYEHVENVFGELTKKVDVQ